MSTVLSGPAADLGKNMRLGVLAGIERANRAGGIHGARLRLITLDDGYEPARAAPNMRQLLEKDNVLAVIGNVGTPTGVAVVPIANERRTLFFAPFTGAGAFRKNPPDRYVFNYRASYAEETGAIIDALLDKGGLQIKDVALFTQRDAYGDAGYAGSIAALKRHGLKNESEVLHVRYERNTLAVEDALATLLYAEHEPRAVVMVGAYAPCAKFIKLAHGAGLRVVFHNVSFVGSTPLAAELGNLPAQVVVTQVVPHPASGDASIVREYRADLRALEPAATPGFGALEGYIATRILLEALERIPGAPTRESIVDALEGLGEFDPGLGEKLRLGPKEHQASHRVWLTALRDGSFLPFPWSDINTLVEKGSAP
ncbi:MAG: ABC transporter substrate-binding protein [Verrucomicrobia bacterium]|nr:ABC transporter substrate-binding protein [Verrucomicrobiota bacterium]MBI3868397.1 ABC transporter substrate-binding protein [Verrucomicrobiota bacterium]